MKKIFFVILLLTSLGLYAQSIDGFRDWKWGTPFSALEQELVKSKNKIPGFKTFDRIGDMLEFEGCKARLITYGFKKDEFRAVNIGLYPDDIDKIIKVITEKYGEPKVTDLDSVENRVWHLKSAEISIAYAKSEKDGLTIGIKGKK
ncbi:MAG: hypothetical protein U5Q03_01285 [Bacteroidota bacterium]|nr:hypothetical protein [Bacteroidota bacterium]